MNIKISILNEFNTELSVYITDLDSYELNKKHNISIERSIDQMIHKIHFEQNLNEKNTEIYNKSDSKKSEIEIKIGEYCECKSACNEYENKTCKEVEKRKEIKQDLPILNGSYGCTIKTKKQEPQQETLEEVAEKESEYLADWEDKEMYKRGFKDGAKWQQERMYSEEEVLVLLHKRDAYNFETNAKSLQEWETPKEWFDKVKNK